MVPFPLALGGPADVAMLREVQRQQEQRVMMQDPQGEAQHDDDEEEGGPGGNSNGHAVPPTDDAEVDAARCKATALRNNEKHREFQQDLKQQEILEAKKQSPDQIELKDKTLEGFSVRAEEAWVRPPKRGPKQLSPFVQDNLLLDIDPALFGGVAKVGQEMICNVKMEYFSTNFCEIGRSFSLYEFEEAAKHVDNVADQYTNLQRAAVRFGAVMRTYHYSWSGRRIAGR